MLSMVGLFARSQICSDYSISQEDMMGATKLGSGVSRLQTSSSGMIRLAFTPDLAVWVKKVRLLE